MEPLPQLNINNNSSNSMCGYTPMVMTTLPNGVQQLQPLPNVPCFESNVSSGPYILPSPVLLPMIDSNGVPFVPPSCSLPALSMSPIHMLPFVPSLSPTMMPIAQPNAQWVVDSQVEATDSNDLFKIKLNDASLRCFEEESGSSFNSYSRSCSPVVSSSSLDSFPSFEQIEREIEVKEPIRNTNNVLLPVFTKEMNKKDLVHATLDYLYALFGANFDTEGNRGPNVLRVKVKTRGALEHISILVEKCVSEGLLSHISCPISTKKARQHIRGYLAYMEAVSDEAAERVIEIFEEYNASILVEDQNTKLMEHPFKGINRDPIAVRPKKC